MIESLDLTRHAVFEASAGTGKTHAIGQVVLRLLTEAVCRLENLLVVTFTEKATGELKDRLRRGIEQAIDRDQSKAILLQRELDQFDQAAILTIHGFCLRLLQNHAADLGQDFQSNFVNDERLRKDVLRDVQRKDWPEIFGARLPIVLRAAGFDRHGADDWEGRILEIVRRYRPECGHRLLPDSHQAAALLLEQEPDAKSLRSCLAIVTIDKMRTRLRELKRQRGAISFDDVIERVALGLDPAHNPRAKAVAAAIREQYCFAVVDEFQDTDALQWNIFRQLFLEEGRSRLMIVGDPKQAIYGFRGADLPTYRCAAGVMVEKWGAASCPLAVNWRSSPEMIEALNRFFMKGEFFPADGMKYVPVAAPPAELLRSRLARDDSGRAAVSVVDVNGEAKTTATQARLAFAAFTAAEIKRLLTGDRGQPLIQIQTPSGPRPLTAADICLLVLKRPEASDFTAALDKQGIPYSFYKSGGLARSAEAGDIRRVLQALADVDQERSFVRAVLTSFFGVTPAEILASGGIPANHPARDLFRKWLAFAEGRQWSELFTSMLEDTGILFRDPSAGDFDRRLANLKFLFGRLQFAAYQRNLDLFELIDVLDDANAEKDADVQPQETDEPRVRIMTFHASKGLEFPIVFVAARFGNEDSEDAPLYRDADGQLVIDFPFLHKESDEQKSLSGRVREERLDELRRLYYVALTRPQFKLYLPFMNPKSRAKDAPLATLIAPAIVRSDLEKATPFAARVDGMAVVDIGAHQQQTMSFERAGSREPDARSEGDLEPPASWSPSLRASGSHDSIAPASNKVAVPKSAPIQMASRFPTFDASIAGRRRQVRSFTGLHRAAKKEQENAFGDRQDRVEEVHEPVSQANDPFRGAVFGEMVHEVFERIEFTDVAAAFSAADLSAGPVGQLIETAAARFLPRLVTRAPDDRLAEECRKLMRGMIWNALRTPLKPLDGMLCHLPKADCVRELEFLFPEATKSAAEGEYRTGFMDLVFRWRDAIYLLDWKTNVLASYDAVGLEAGMQDAGYGLQIQLYWEALSRWLRRGAKASKTRLGGVFYLFLRGLNGMDDSTGVYYVPASKVTSMVKRNG